MVTKYLKKTNNLNLSANDSIQCFTPVCENIGIVNYDGGGNIWISLEKEATIGSQDCICLPSPGTWEFPREKAGNTIYLMTDIASVAAIYCT